MFWRKNKPPLSVRQVSNDPSDPSFVKPGKPDAIKRGCLCEANQRGEVFRDGVGYKINPECALHSEWPELAE